MLIQFNEKEHKYIHSETNEQYISVTQLIHRYVNEFDGEYWSKYKAIERIVTEAIGEQGWKNWKREIGGFKKVNDAFFAQAKQENIDRVKLIQIDILQEWDAKNKLACDEGSEFHENQENYWKSKWVHMFKNKFRNYREQTQHSNATHKTIEDGIYTEFRVWSEYYKIAGHADLPVVEKPYIDINDYKTNKKLEFDNYCDPNNGHQMLKGSLSHLKDCNGIHYNLQLSLYAKLFQLSYGLIPRHIQIDYAIRDKDMKLTENMQHIPLPYMDREINLILRDREIELYGKDR